MGMIQDYTSLVGNVFNFKKFFPNDSCLLIELGGCSLNKVLETWYYSNKLSLLVGCRLIRLGFYLREFYHYLYRETGITYLKIARIIINRTLEFRTFQVALAVR